MARGLVNALQLALGAVEGAASGYGAKQDRERKRQLEEAALARQKQLDEAAIRREQRELADAGFVTTDALSRMTMPGATPLPSMQPTMRQTVGGQEYAYVPSMARAEEHKADVMKRSLARGEKEYERTQEEKRIQGRITAARGKPRTSPEAAMLAAESPNAFSAMYPDQPRVDPLDALRIQEIQRERAQQEAEGLAYINANRTNPEVTTGVATILERNPRMSVGQIGYALMQQGGKTATEAQREASAASSRTRTTGKPAGRAPAAPPPGFAADAVKPTSLERPKSAAEDRVERERQRLLQLYPSLAKNTPAAPTSNLFTGKR